MTAIERTRVLQAYKVFYPEVFGGIPYVMDRIRNIRPDLFDHKLLVCSKNPKLFYDERVERVKSYADILSLPFSPFYPIRLWLESCKADVVFLHAPFPLVDLVYGLGLNRQTKLIIYWHSEIVRQKRWALALRWFIDRTLDRAAVIIVSDSAILEGTSALSRHSDKCIIAPFPVDVDRFELTDAERGVVEEIAQKKPRLIVSCGRLVGYKGFDILIQAVGSLEGVQLVIIGDGPERCKLQAQIDANLLSERVTMIGALNDRDLVCYLHAAKAFALTSVSEAETFGIAQLEAMACGCPVINTNLPTAVPNVARNGLEAVTVPSSDPEALAKAISFLLSDEKMAKKLGLQGRERALGTFSINNFNIILEAVMMPSTSSCNAV